MDPVRGRRRLGLACSAVAALFVFAAGASGPAHAREPFPQSDVANRGQAESILAAHADGPADSLSTRIADLLSGATRTPAQAVRAARTLRTGFAAYRTDGAALLPGAVPLSFTTDPHSLDAIDPTDEDGDGVPDTLSGLRDAWAGARSLLQDDLGLALPNGLQVTVVRVDADTSGYVLPASALAGPRIVLDPAPPGGSEALARATVRETAFATVLTA